MEKIFIIIVSFLISILAITSSVFNSGGQVVQLASADQHVCPDGGEWTKVDGLSDLTYTFTVPTGFVVVENCMKVGDHDPVFGTGNTVTNTTLFNSPGGVTCTALGVPHNGCTLQNISHASFRLQLITSPTPTDSPTPTPTDTPSPTPSDSPTPTTDTVTPTPTEEVTPTPTDVPTVTPDCSGASCNTGGVGDRTPTPTLIITASPTQTLTATPTADATPTSTPGIGGSGNVLGTSVTPTDVVDSQKSVLGATTMAATGTFVQNLMNLMFALGMLSLSGGSLMYAKTKKA